jgi:integrase
VCALRWSDVDLEAATVRIARSVSATKSAGVAIRPTKTGSVRLVSLTAPAVEALARHRTRTEKAAASIGRRVDPDDQIFASDPEGRRPWRPELATRRWERLRARSGLGHMRIHDLRRFVATQLLTAGIDVRTVANRLGHARTSTTLDIYWAWVPARDRDAARHIEAILG